MATVTTLQVGTYNAVTDTFTSVFDLNDGVTTKTQSYDPGMPEKVDTRSFTLRVPGERVAKYQHKNRLHQVSLFITAASTTALLAAQHAMIAAIEDPIAHPYTLKIVLAGGATASYADVRKCVYKLPYKALQYLQGYAIPITLTFETDPYFRGTRQTLANAVSNPGFEAPMGGGTAQTAPQVFNDPLSTTNAYAAATALTYTQAVFTDRPIHYLPLNEASGTVANELIVVGGSSNGTYAGTITYGVAGPAGIGNGVTFGASGQVTVSTNNLPTGNAAWSLEAWCKIAANPAGNVYLIEFGNNGTAHQQPGIVMNSSGGVFGSTNGGDTTATAALSLNVWHHVALTWDGTTLRLYLDGAAGPTATPAALTINATGIEAKLSGTTTGFNFPGSLAAGAYYNYPLSATQVQQHFQIGGNTFSVTALALASNVLTVAAATKTSFGSPAWGAIQTWQMRFQYATGLQATVVLHYQDAQNYLACVVGGTSMTLYHVVAGVYHAMAVPGAYTQLTNGTFYWLQATQFPGPPGSQPQVQVILANDSAGAIGATIQSAGPTNTADAVTALLGKPALWSTGANLALGGNFANVQSVALFGPGGWLCTSKAGSATGTSSGAWEGDQVRGASGTTANTYPNGPVTSYGTARIDLPPAGTADALWRLYTGGAPAGTQAIPVQTPGNVVYARVAAKSSGLGNGATVALKYSEYDSTGTLLRSGTLQTLTISGGVQIAWPAAGAWNLAGNWATGANCAYVDLQVEVADTTAGSANGTVWIDNAQAWDSTRLGVTAMPYGETRFPTSPGQYFVTGVVGDIRAPAVIQCGLYLAAFATGQSITLYLGRRLTSQAGGILLSPPSADTLTAKAGTLDTASFGGYYFAGTISNSATAESDLHGPTSSPAGMQQAAGLTGAFRLLARLWSADATPASVTTQPIVQSSSLVAGAGGSAYVYTPATRPIGTGSVWTVTDNGVVQSPPGLVSPLEDLTQVNVLPGLLITGSAVTAYNARLGSLLLLPSDAETVVATVNNPTNAAALNTQWLWLYLDAIAGALNTYSLEATPVPNILHGTGATGSLSSHAANSNATSGRGLYLDPTQATANGTGVNQFGASVHDNTGAAVGSALEVLYSPYYLFPPQ